MKSTVSPYTTAAWCVRIECVGGTVARLTSYPVDLTMSNATVYKTDSGYEATAYTSGTTAAPAALDIEGIAGIAGISRDQLASGVFDNARVYIFKCDFTTPIEDYEPVMAGFLGKTTLMDEHYRIEGMSMTDALNQSVGKTYTALCAHTFGDSGCGKNLAALQVTGTLTAVTDSATVRDSARAEAADYFGAGTLHFTSGTNAGLRPIEVKSHAADGTIIVYEPFYYLPAIGDAYVLVPGCRRRLTDCKDKWNNVINRFAFDFIPTGSDYTKIGGLTT